MQRLLPVLMARGHEAASPQPLPLLGRLTGLGLGIWLIAIGFNGLRGLQFSPGVRTIVSGVVVVWWACTDYRPRWFRRR